MAVHRQQRPVAPRARITRLEYTPAGYGGPVPANDNMDLGDDLIRPEPEGISPIMLVPIAGILVCAFALFLFL